MTRSTATEHFGQHTETARAGWMTADAGTAIQHRQHVIKQHIPLIASARASHFFMLKLLRIWRSTVSVFRADREVIYLGTVHWTSVTTLAALFGTFSCGESPVKTDGTLSPTARRPLVIIADDFEAVGLPLTSPTWNTDLVQVRWTMPSEEPPDENPSAEEDEPVLPPEIQHPCDECEWIGRSAGSLRGNKIMAHGYRSQIEISCPQCPQCGKKTHHHLQCQSSHQASVMFTVKVLQYQINLSQHAPRAPSTQICWCPGSVKHGSNCLWRYFSRTTC